MDMIMITSSRVVALSWLWEGGDDLKGPPSTNCLRADVAPPNEIGTEIANGTYTYNGDCPYPPCYVFFWSAHHIAKLPIEDTGHCEPTGNTVWEIVAIPSQKEDVAAQGAVFSESRFSRSVTGPKSLMRRETWAVNFVMGDPKQGTTPLVTAPAYYLSEIVNVRSQNTDYQTQQSDTFAWVQKVNASGMLFFGNNDVHTVKDWAHDEGTVFLLLLFFILTPS
jgi:hypothetical protein